MLATDRLAELFRPLGGFEELERVAADLLGAAHPLLAETRATPLDLWADDQRAVARVELPGVLPDAIDVTVERDMLRIAATRVAPVTEGQTLLRRERQHGRVERQVRLPFAVDTTAVSARYVDGVLTVELPRAEADKPRRIAIEGEAR